MNRFSIRVIGVRYRFLLLEGIWLRLRCIRKLDYTNKTFNLISFDYIDREPGSWELQDNHHFELKYIWDGVP